MKINLKLKDWKLRHKIILHVFIIGALATVFLAVLYISTQQNIVEIFNRQRAELVTSMVECNITHLMNQEEDDVIKPALKRISDLNIITEIRILDQEGLILHSSEADEVGTSVPDEIKNLIREEYSRSDPDDFFTLKSISEIESYLPIENKPECFRCHNPENRINGILQIRLDTSRTHSLLRQNHIRGIVIALLALAALILIILRLFEKIINRPLSVLKNQMKQVQEGNLDVRLEPKKKDEIGALTQSFNLMVGKLKQANQRIEDLHNQQIERAGHLASIGELAAGLAHEIKNPIAGIKGALEIIAGKTSESDPQKEIFFEILKQTERIHLIIQDLLSYAKPREMNKDWALPESFILGAKKLAEAQIQDKEIRFSYQGPRDKKLKVYVDDNKLQEVILNLLINGIAAIEQNGEICISAEQNRNEQLEITITDTGKGIKPEQLGRIFQPFFSTKKAGTGLGLSICKKIMDDHNGDIEVKSEPGRGTTFILRLPLGTESGR